MALFPSRGFRVTRDRSSPLLLDFGVDDLSLALPSGQSLVFDRNSQRTAFDSLGQVISLAQDQMPWSAVFNAAASIWEPMYDAQDGTTNLCLQSENFGATWAAIGTPTRTAAAKRCGDLLLDLIGDDTAATLEGYSQVIGFTANALKAVAVFVAPGTSTSSVVRLRDTTAAANRLLATITWSAGVPSVAMTTGTFLGSIACASGVYRLHFQTTSVTATNTNQIEIYPATTSGLAVANTGTLYVGGVQCENKEYPHAYIQTTTATVATLTDSLSVLLSQSPLDFTVFARFQVPVQQGLSGPVNGVVGRNTNTPNWNIALLPGSPAQVVVRLDSGAGSVSATATVPSSGVIDMCAQFADIATAGRVRVDVGSGFGAYSGTTGAVSVWAGTTVVIGAFEWSTGPLSPLDGGIRRVRIAAGARTLAQMRGVSS